MIDERKPKEIVLKSVRDSLINRMDNPFKDLDWESSVFANTGSLDIVGFVNKFVEVGGQFCFCPDVEHFRGNMVGLYQSMNWKNVFCKDEYAKGMLDGCGLNIISNADSLVTCQTTITGCDYLIARTGSIMATSKTMMSRKLQVFPENHIVYAYISQLVPDLKTALNNLLKMNRILPSMIVNITGSSRTADIEKTLVKPAHGPRTIYLFLIDGN